MNYDSPKEIREFLVAQEIALKKKWGQNFLISQNAREKIISRVAPEASDFIWEIGPGLGAMTAPVLESGARLLAFEIDRGMIRSLGHFFGTSPHFEICEGDFVKTFVKALEEKGPPTKIFGNLPYSSASKIILELIARKIKPRNLVFTVQKELAQRMTSAPSRKSYSSYSVICQYSYDIELITDLAPHSFYPQPDVVSSAIELTPRDHVPPPRDENFFYALCRSAFSSKRKTLLNNLHHSGLVHASTKEALSALLTSQGLGPDARAEEMDIERFISLSNALVELNSGAHLKTHPLP
jgi:16S rRNA (adenine1518-N6/adenine1519-N6)-dimethyltransferase